MNKLDRIRGNTYSPCATDDINWLVAELERRRETLGKLPKCWQLRDGKLVQDCPVVPGEPLWFCGDDGADDEAIAIIRLVCFEGSWLANDEFVESWCLTHKAAEALALRERSDDAEN